MALQGETESNRDERYLAILRRTIDVCANYRPKFGQGGGGLTVHEFQALHSADPFYHWIGLDSPLLYAAHRAGGGMTSVYRQIGLGCERLVRQILQDELGLSPEQATWEYQIATPEGRTRTLKLDGRIQLAQIRNEAARTRVEAWLAEARQSAGVSEDVNLIGTVFEIRQGYKSKDAKRQNADIGNAGAAYAAAYLPTLMILSTQLDADLQIRYRAARWLLLMGTTAGSSLESTYIFANEVLGYDLAAFFSRVSEQLRAEVEAVLETLLSADDG